MWWAGLIHQKGLFWKTTQCINLTLKTMCCYHQIIIPHGGQQSFSSNYVSLLYFQMQTWKGFFIEINSIKITLINQSISYSLHGFLHMRTGGLILFTANMSKIVSIVDVTSRNLDLGKTSARCSKNKNKKY